MKLIFHKRYLTEALKALSGMIPPRPSVPILSQAKITADENIHISGTDLDVGGRVVVDGEVVEKGEVCIPFKALMDIAVLADEQIEIKTESESVTIKSGKSKWKLNTLPADEFPNFPETEGFTFTLQTEFIQTLLQRTMFCVSREESRYALNGALFKGSGGRLEVVSTDGRRLSLTEHQTGLQDDFQMIVPLKGLSELKRMNSEVDVIVGENEVVFKNDLLTIFSRLIKGEFVDYGRIIPKPNFEVKFSREDLLNGVRKIRTIKTDTDRTITLTISKGLIKLSGTSEHGTVSDELECTSGGEVEIVFNVDYLAEYLSAEVDDVEMGVVDGASPAVFGAGAYKHILMPLKK